MERKTKYTFLTCHTLYHLTYTVAHPSRLTRYRSLGQSVALTSASWFWLCLHNRSLWNQNHKIIDIPLQGLCHHGISSKRQAFESLLHCTQGRNWAQHWERMTDTTHEYKPLVSHRRNSHWAETETYKLVPSWRWEYLCAQVCIWGEKREIICFKECRGEMVPMGETYRICLS